MRSIIANISLIAIALVMIVGFSSNDGKTIYAEDGGYVLTVGSDAVQAHVLTPSTDMAYSIEYCGGKEIGAFEKGEPNSFEEFALNAVEHRCRELIYTTGVQPTIWSTTVKAIAHEHPDISGYLPLILLC